MPEQDDHTKQYIPVQCHYTGHRRDPYDLDLKQYILDNAPNSPGGGVALESYQNSAMSAAVMAYVFRDQSNNIFRVYEPMRNNDVSRKTFAYADSIDKFPFDNVNIFNNICSDLKPLGFASDIVFWGNTIYSSVINVNSHIGFVYINNKQWGNFGNDTPNNAEIYCVGDNVLIVAMKLNNGSTEETTNDFPACIDSIGDQSKFAVSIMESGAQVLCNGHSVGGRYILDYSTMRAYSTIELLGDLVGDDLIGNTHGEDSITYLNGPGGCQYCNIQQNAQVTIENTILNSDIGISAIVDTEDGSLTNCNIGNNSTYSPSANKTNANIINISGATYELGESSGNATLTPV